MPRTERKLRAWPRTMVPGMGWLGQDAKSLNLDDESRQIKHQKTDSWNQALNAYLNLGT